MWGSAERSRAGVVLLEVHRTYRRGFLNTELDVASPSLKMPRRAALK